MPPISLFAYIYTDIPGHWFAPVITSHTVTVSSLRSFSTQPPPSLIFMNINEGYNLLHVSLSRGKIIYVQVNVFLAAQSQLRLYVQLSSFKIFSKQVKSEVNLYFKVTKQCVQNCNGNSGALLLDLVPQSVFPLFIHVTTHAIY